MADLKATLSLDRKSFDTGLSAAEKSVSAFAAKAGGILLGGFAIHEVVGKFMESIEKLDRVAKLSKAFDVPTETLQRLGGVAELSGSNIEDVAKALGKMSKAVFSAKQDGGSMATAFQALGISMADLKSMSSQDVFLKVADGLSKIENPVTRAGIGMQIFGKSFLSIAPMMAQGGAAISQLASTMSVASDQAVESAEKIDDALKNVRMTLHVLMGTFAVALGPLITFVTTGVEQMMTFANSLTQVVSGEKEFKNLMKDIARDQENLKQRQITRVIMGASDAELQKESNRLAVPEEVPDNASAFDKALRQQIQAEIKRRETMKKLKNNDAEDLVGKNQAKAMEDAAKATQDMERAQERLAQATRDRETLDMDNAEKLNRAQQEYAALLEKISSLSNNEIAQIDAKTEAEKKLIEIKQLEVDIARQTSEAIERQSRAQEDQAKAAERVANLNKEFESMQAGLAGRKEEIDLQVKRTKEAGAKARQSQTIEDRNAAMQETVKIASIFEKELLGKGYEPAAAHKIAGQEAMSLVGKLPTFGDFKPNQDIINLANAVRDNANILQSKQNDNTELKNITDKCREAANECVKKLDQILAASGTFGL